MKLTFELAAPAHVDVLADMVREFYAHDGSAFDEQAVRSALLQLLNGDAFGEAYLIMLDGEVVGYIVLTLGFSLEYHGRDAFVDEIFLKESCRGLGIGARALQLVEEVCRRRGVRALHLEVGRTNAGAQALYRKAGFASHDRLLMSKRLEG